MNKYEYSCSRCNYFVETSGPWPYYGGRTGKVGNPECTDNIWGPIYGLTAKVYCRTCDKEKDYIIVEYKTPLDTLDDVWLSEVSRKTKMVCHKCKNPVFLALLKKPVKCPRCKKGIFEPYHFEEDIRLSMKIVPRIAPPVREGTVWIRRRRCEDLPFYVADFSKALFGALQIGQVQSSGNCSKGTFSTFSS